ncbi:MAG TPA: flagellar hook capping FlgD N-terminal domain-containing protein [Pseudolabrys sp.]|nr:flagellar hook capping FlgD N-terminal domain-containing protein [Pseudolabrys sp.]
MAITATPVSNTPTVTTTGTSNSSSIDQASIANNFQTFLTLLTTQLKNQNPLDPLDTNQFTQQLVQFAQVEQQMKQNDHLATLISLEQNAQATTALAYVGQTVIVDGATTGLINKEAMWSLTSSKPASATVTIKDQNGQTAYTGTFSLNAGTQQFVWDGISNSGEQWPEGNYTLSVTAKDANGQAVSISTEVMGVVDSADLTQSPATLSIGGQDYAINKIKRIVRSF